MNKEILISDLASLLLYFPSGQLFICTECDHYKFWHVIQDKNNVNVSWGRIGNRPQKQVEKFTNSFTCHNFINKKIQEKIKKGYTLVERA